MKSSSTSSLFSTGMAYRVVPAYPGNVLDKALPPGFKENDVNQPWSKHHAFSAIIREHGSNTNLVALENFIQSMKSSYYAARRVQSASENPTCTADQLAAAIDKLDIRLQAMNNYHAYCGDWLDNNDPVCINDRYKIILDAKIPYSQK